MKTTLEGSRIDDRAEPKPDCDATFMRAEIRAEITSTVSLNKTEKR